MCFTVYLGLSNVRGKGGNGAGSSVPRSYRIRLRRHRVRHANTQADLTHETRRSEHPTASRHTTRRRTTPPPHRMRHDATPPTCKAYTGRAPTLHTPATHRCHAIVRLSTTTTTRGAAAASRYVSPLSGSSMPTPCRAQHAGTEPAQRTHATPPRQARLGRHARRAQLPTRSDPGSLGAEGVYPLSCQRRRRARP